MTKPPDFSGGFSYARARASVHARTIKIRKTKEKLPYLQYFATAKIYFIDGAN